VSAYAPPYGGKILRFQRKTKLELAYEDHLALRKAAGEILHWGYETHNLRLAQRTFYMPDFSVVLPTHMEFHEIKGHWEDDARVKIKVAAEMYPFYRWCAVTRTKGIWQWEWFN